MTAIVYLVFIAFCCVNAAEIPVNRINIGNIATDNQFPYAVSIQQISELASTLRGHRCGGVLITLQHVLTAASCTYDVLVNGSLQLIQPNAYRVFGGAALLANDNSAERIRSIVTVTPHRDYAATPNLDNNIAVLTLASPFTSSVVTPLSLPDSTFVAADGANCTVAGWGASDSSVQASAQLRYSYKFIWNKNSCISYYNILTNEPAVPSTALCAEHSMNNVTSCKGDEGNGLVCSGVLSGIFVHGSNCSIVSRPEIYTQVSSYSTWIRNVTESTSSVAAYRPTAVLLAVFTAVQMLYSSKCLR